MMSRRAFVAAVASTVIAAPFAIDAQQHSSKLHRIGFLGSESAANQASWLEALQAGLRDLGYVEGQNLMIEVRWAEGNNASNPPSSLEAMEAVTKALKIELRQYKARNPGEFEGAIAKMVQQRIDAIVVQGDTMFMVNARSLADLAIKYRLPSAGILEYAEAGGMMGSGADLTENHRRAAIYVDKILKGTKPGDLPIEQATKFRLILNLRTAQALGLAIPPGTGAARRRCDPIVTSER